MSSIAFINATDLAARWDVCRATVVGWCRDGLIPGACKVGPTGQKGLHWPQWRIPLEWVAEGERKSVKQLQKEISDSIKQRKRATWDKVSVRLEKGRKRD